MTTDVIHLWTTLIPDPYQRLQKNRMDVIYVWVMGSIPLARSGVLYSITVALRNWCRARMCFIHFDEHVHVGEWMRDRTAWSDEAGYGKSLWLMTTFWRIEWDWTFFGLQMSWLMILAEAIRIRHWWIRCFNDLVNLLILESDLIYSLAFLKFYVTELEGKSKQWK